MSTLGLAVLAALAVAAAVILIRVVRRRPGVEPGSPRTVADLVRMRAEQAADAPPAVDPVTAEPATAEPVAQQPVDEPRAAPARPRTPAVALLPGSDTPWGRAARMSGGAGAVWATGESEHGVHDRPRLRPVVLPEVSPDLFGPRPVLAVVTTEPEPASVLDATPEELAVRRRTAAETAAEQAAADLALLRTFGGASAHPDLDDDSDATMSPAGTPAATEAMPGATRIVAFRVVGRDGDGIDGAGVTLLDDRGRETATAAADAKGRGELRAPHPGEFMLVSAAAGHQPGAVAVTVGGEPVEAEVLLARSASVVGTVFGEDGPIVGARLTLVQDGEIVDSTGTGPHGEYWISDLAAGEYGLSVSAHDCEPVALALTVPDATDLHHDVELVPVGLPAAAPAGDLMIGQL